TDLAGGPEVSLYVGSTRRVLVMHSARLFVANGSVTQGVEVAGASNIPVGSQVENADLLNQNPLSVWAAVSASTVLTADSGLQQGTNVFRCRYQADAHDNPNPSVLQVASRTITVIPF
ncbi:hypothetical protein, partial [Prauserella endophytica]|uniref:hypothetical protein n=1 Tax=Prauserella endophytica TaxID=1592324 RepID=UPI001305456F